MAFNWQTFRTRSLSAVIFLMVMAAGLLWDEWSFILLFSLVHFGCWIEYNRLLQGIHKTSATSALLLSSFMVLGFGLMLSLTTKELPAWSFTLQEVGWGIASAALLLLLVSVAVKGKNNNWTIIFSFFAGLVYISLSLGLLLGLRTKTNYSDAAHALSIPLLIIFTNWINDTMAYIVGSLIGKTPLSPISPKKTWEGTIGGAILAVLTISLIAYFTGLVPVGHAAALSALGAVSGTYGDLFESKLKRMAGVKDSGTMMPGHGGFLDRFDSLLFSATAGAIYTALIM